MEWLVEYPYTARAICLTQRCSSASVQTRHEEKRLRDRERGTAEREVQGAALREKVTVPENSLAKKRHVFIMETHTNA